MVFHSPTQACLEEAAITRPQIAFLLSGKTLARGGYPFSDAGMFEEAAITLRRLYGEDASLCLEARATERLAEMMLDAGRAERAYGERRGMVLMGL